MVPAISLVIWNISSYNSECDTCELSLCSDKINMLITTGVGERYFHRRGKLGRSRLKVGSFHEPWITLIRIHLACMFRICVQQYHRCRIAGSMLPSIYA